MTAAVREASADAISLDDAFAGAMAGPAKPREAAPPPEVDNDAPHGRAEDGTPLAPYGLTKAGKPRKGPQGRPAKPDEEPRTAAAAAVAEQARAPGPRKPGAAYSQSLNEFGDAIWMGGSVLAVIGPKMPLVGQYIPGQKMAAAAEVLDRHKPRLVAAVCLAADHSERARRLAEKIDTGDATWAVVAGMLVLPMVQELGFVLRGDKALAGAELPLLADRAAANEAKLNEYMKKLGDQMEAQAADLARQAGEQTGE